jgi:hypothetical protein
VVAVRLEAQEVPHPHAQLGTIDRFGEEVFGSGVQPEQPGIAIFQGGDHDDGNVLGPEVSLDRARHLVTINARHHDVEQDEVRRFLRDDGERFLAAGSSLDEKLFRSEHDFQQLSAVGLIVDDQNA